MRFFGPRVRGSFNISKVVHRKETTPACIERSAKVLADHPSLSLSLSVCAYVSLSNLSGMAVQPPIPQRGINIGKSGLRRGLAFFGHLPVLHLPRHRLFRMLNHLP